MTFPARVLTTVSLLLLLPLTTVYQSTDASELPSSPASINTDATVLMQNAIGVLLQEVMLSPQLSAERLQRLFQDPTLHSLFTNHHNQQVLTEGNLTRIAGLQDVQQLKQNQDLQALLDIRSLHDQQIAAMLASGWQHNLQLQNDPQLMAVWRDPAIQRMWQQGDLLAILMHPAGRQLINRLLYPPSPANSNDLFDTVPEDGLSNRQP